MAQFFSLSPSRDFPRNLTSLRVGIDAFLATELKEN